MMTNKSLDKKTQKVFGSYLLISFGFMLIFLGYFLVFMEIMAPTYLFLFSIPLLLSTLFLAIAIQILYQTMIEYNAEAMWFAVLSFWYAFKINNPSGGVSWFWMLFPIYFSCIGALVSGLIVLLIPSMILSFGFGLQQRLEILRSLNGIQNVQVKYIIYRFFKMFWIEIAILILLWNFHGLANDGKIVPGCGIKPENQIVVITLIVAIIFGIINIILLILFRDSIRIFFSLLPFCQESKIKIKRKVKKEKKQKVSKKNKKKKSNKDLNKAI